MPEKIEVGYRKLNSFLGQDYYHKFLIYTDKHNKQYTISGWTDEQENITENLPFGRIRVLAHADYNAMNPDHPSNLNAQGQIQHREHIITSTDLSQTWMKMVQNAQNLDGIYPYDYLRQNSNTLADNILRSVELPEPQLDGLNHYWSPGSGNQLNENLRPLPSPENVSNISNISANIPEYPENNKQLLTNSNNLNNVDWSNPTAVYQALGQMGQNQQSQDFMASLQNDFRQSQQAEQQVQQQEVALESPQQVKRGFARS